MSVVIRSAFHLEPGDKLDFSVTTRYTDHTVAEIFEDERRGKCARLVTPAGSERVFPLVTMGDIEAQRSP